MCVCVCVCVMLTETSSLLSHSVRTPSIIHKDINIDELLLSARRSLWWFCNCLPCRHLRGQLWMVWCFYSFFWSMYRLTILIPLFTISSLKTASNRVNGVIWLTVTDLGFIFNTFRNCGRSQILHNVALRSTWRYFLLRFYQVSERISYFFTSHHVSDD